LKQPQVLPGRVGLDQVLLAADLSDLEEVDQGFDGVLLEIVVLEPPSVGQAVVGAKPPVEQPARGISCSHVVAHSPGVNLLADRRHAGSGARLHVEQRRGGRVRFLLAAHRRFPRYFFTFTFRVLVVSLPRMSITFTATRYSP